MTREIRKELNQAKGLYKNGKKEEAFEIYDRHFNENPDKFDHWDKIRYCWCIYYLFIRDSNNEHELAENVEKVTGIVKQENLNKSPVCVYTQCVFKMIMFLKAQNDWEYMLYWLDKLNPKLLSETQRDSGDVTYPSKKEEYYKFLSKAYLQCGEYEDCIEVSKEALNRLTNFALNGDVWHKWNIAKSLRMLNRSSEALTYLEDVAEVQKDWFVYKEFAENYHVLNDNENALRFAAQSVLTNDPAEIKVNVYHLIYNILKDSDPELALKHAELYLGIKIENGGLIDEDIEELEIDEDDIDIDALEGEIKSYWQEFNFHKTDS